MDTITVNGIEYVRKDMLTPDESRYDDLVANIKSDLTMLLENAQTVYDDFSKNGFTVNTIEAEGFLRGIKTAETYILEQIELSQ